MDSVGRRSPFLLLILFAGLLAIFFLPYVFPVEGGLSDSFIVGFNNHASLWALVATAAIFGIVSRGLNLRMPSSGDPQSPLSVKLLCVSIAGVAAAGVGIWLLTRPYGATGEATFFLDRYSVFSLGRLPYRDFDYPYGPLMFYPPVLLAHLVHIRIADAYYLFWIAQWCAGVAVLWATVRWAAQHTPHRTAIYILLLLNFLPALLDAGPNYSPFRFCCSLLLALAVHRLYFGRHNLAPAFVTAAIGTILLLFYSPEEGVAFAIGTILFFTLCTRGHRRGTLAALTGFAALVALAILIAYRAGFFNAARDFSAGAHNFPLLLGPFTLVLLLLLIFVGVVATAAFRTSRAHHPLIYLIAISIPLLPSAMARCDPGHILFNLFGAIVAVLVVLSQYPRLWRPTWIALLCMALAGAALHSVYAHGLVIGPLKERAFAPNGGSPKLQRIYRKLLYTTRSHDEADRKMNENQQELAVMRAVQPQLAPGTMLYAPFGVARRVRGTPGGLLVDTGRYFSYLALGSPRVPQQKIDELRAHPGMLVLLPADEAHACTYDFDAERKTLRQLFLPVAVPHARNSLLSAQSLCDYIQDHYHPTDFKPPTPTSRVWAENEDSRAASAK